MFYIWHTLLIIVFIVVAYSLGYRLGKEKIRYKTRYKKPTLTLVSDKETSHEEWLRGYHEWKKQFKNQN